MSEPYDLSYRENRTAYGPEYLSAPANLDSRSQLERDFDSGVEMEAASLRKLVNILKAERDCWLTNCKTLEKERNRK